MLIFDPADYVLTSWKFDFVFMIMFDELEHSEQKIKGGVTLIAVASNIDID